MKAKYEVCNEGRYAHHFSCLRNLIPALKNKNGTITGIKPAFNPYAAGS